MLKNADAALYWTKEQGGNGIRYYAAAMNTRALEWLLMEKHLHYALKRQELALHYQPQVDLNSGQVIGVEALLRWRRPGLGMVPPAEFIPLAEKTGLILPIGAWVLRTACTQAKSWQDQGLPALRVAVNISPRQFMRVNLAEQVARTLQDTGLAAPCLELEITESLLMQDMERGIATLHALKAMGIQLAIDDFGTGYSSLAYLKRFPIDRLKIDRSFVQDLTTDPDNAAITEAVIALAHTMRLQVIAEGVETEAQLAFLRSRSCNEIQGYYFSPPLPAEEVASLLGIGTLSAGTLT